MSIIQKIVFGTKVLFGNWLSALDYALDILNGFLARPVTASRIAAGYRIATCVLGYLKRFRGYCPAPWAGAYDALVSATEAFVVVFEDGRVDSAEVADMVARFKAAYAAWNS